MRNDCGKKLRLNFHRASFRSTHGLPALVLSPGRSQMVVDSIQILNLL
jgi:hypothetical protein